jgi:exopolyphosphatase/guanosine-5'-triphosphate,3'-diphosphate pyrophosphatase
VRKTLSAAILTDTVLDLARPHGFDEAHAIAVSRLAVRLFDDLQLLHRMGQTERIWLRVAALLHDVGKQRDPATHHKIARDVISRASGLPFGKKERRIIALIARYHRGNLPQDTHKHFGRLSRDAQQYVRKLAALLRIADGLDRRDRNPVRNLASEVCKKHVALFVQCRKMMELDKVFRKSDLFEQVYGKKLLIEIITGPSLCDIGLDSDLDYSYALVA